MNDDESFDEDRLAQFVMGDEKSTARMTTAVRSEAGSAYMQVVMPTNTPLWERRVLPLKTTAMVNLAILACLNRPHELYTRVTGLLRGGISVREIQEVFLHVGFYVGNPAGVEATVTLHEVMADLEARGIEFART